MLHQRYAEMFILIVAVESLLHVNIIVAKNDGEEFQEKFSTTREKVIDDFKEKYLFGGEPYDDNRGKWIELQNLNVRNSVSNDRKHSIIITNARETSKNNVEFRKVLPAELADRSNGAKIKIATMEFDNSGVSSTSTDRKYSTIIPNVEEETRKTNVDFLRKEKGKQLKSKFELPSDPDRLADGKINKKMVTMELDNNGGASSSNDDSKIVKFDISKLNCLIPSITKENIDTGLQCAGIATDILTCFCPQVQVIKKAAEAVEYLNKAKRCKEIYDDVLNADGVVEKGERIRNICEQVRRTDVFSSSDDNHQQTSDNRNNENDGERPVIQIRRRVPNARKYNRGR